MHNNQPVQLLSWSLLFLFLIFSPGTTNSSLLKYQLKIEHPDNHLAQVQLEVPVQGEDTLTLAMPAWSPGRYVIYNFAKNVFDVKAYNQSGGEIRPVLVDKQTWKIPVAGAQKIKISYQVFANTLDGTFSKIDSGGASINGSSIFAYIVEKKNLPVKLHIDAPAHWQIVCSLDPLAENNFKASCYDQLIDCPIEMGRLFKYHFKTQGKDHFLIFHQPIKADLLKLFQKDLKKVISFFAALFDEKLPYEHYTFFFHLKEELEHTDGMEHANACRVILRMNPDQIISDANTDPDYDNLIWLSAHEFFHTWNVKRLRPNGLGPFDYSKEVYTPSLWIVEGWTSYYAYLALLRTGIYTEEKFLSELAGRITRYENSPGKMYRTLTETSILTWLFKGGVPHYAQTNIEQTTYSYYYKGLITGFLLDILLRSDAHPISSLDALLREMWFRFYKAGKSDYYLSGIGYHEREIEQMIVEKTGEDGRTFLHNAVHSTAPLPYELVEKLGLKLLVTDNKFTLVKQAHPSPKAQHLWQVFKTGNYNQ